MCNIEKHINNFYKKNSERTDCKSRRNLNRYYDNKDEISSQRNIYYKKLNYYRNKMMFHTLHFDKQDEIYTSKNNLESTLI